MGAFRGWEIGAGDDLPPQQGLILDHTILRNRYPWLDELLRVLDPALCLDDLIALDVVKTRRLLLRRAAELPPAEAALELWTRLTAPLPPLEEVPKYSMKLERDGQQPEAAYAIVTALMQALSTAVEVGMPAWVWLEAGPWHFAARLRELPLVSRYLRSGTFPGTLTTMSSTTLGTMA
jgi:hypothetical protein